MEAASEPQHRTKVNSSAGRLVGVSVPGNATPDIQSRQDGIRSGGGGKSACIGRVDYPDKALKACA